MIIHFDFFQFNSEPKIYFIPAGFLAVLDASTLGEFRKYAIQWQLSAACEIAGFFGVLSSELSVFTLAVVILFLLDFTNSLCSHNFNFVSADHNGAELCNHACDALEQAAEFEARGVHHDRRLVLLDSHGLPPSFWRL